MEENTGMLCDTATGVCGVPGTATAADMSGSLNKGQHEVQIVYYTDPICSSCWGIEPMLRKLKLEYGHVVDIHYKMGGLLPSWNGFNGGGITKPSDVAGHWDEVSHHYEMPIDGDVWLTDPLPSSYPPSIAYIAAELQDEEKAHLFLRRIREMVFLEKKNITKWEHILAAATSCGLDGARLQSDMNGKAQVIFEQELKQGREMGVRGFPTLFIAGKDGAQTIYGFRPYAQFEAALLKVNPKAVKQNYDHSAKGVFKYYKSYTLKEFMTLTELESAAAKAALAQLEQEGYVSRYDTKNGSIWTKM